MYAGVTQLVQSSCLIHKRSMVQVHPPAPGERVDTIGERIKGSHDPIPFRASIPVEIHVKKTKPGMRRYSIVVIQLLAKQLSRVRIPLLAPFIPR